MTHEAPQDQPQLATGDVLRAHLDATAESTDSVSHFTNSMARLLADRLDGQPGGVVPEGYAMVTQLLLYDCKDTGKNGFTDEPMPSDVTGQPPLMYGLFQDRSVELASEAFGEPFGDAVKKVYSEIRENMDAAAATKPPEPKLAPGQLDGAFSAIAKGDTSGIEPVNKVQAYEVLHEIEGVDPVEAVLDGHPQDIPKEGWVIDANMQLGSSAVINVIRYDEGAEFSRSADWQDHRAEHGKGAIWMSLRGYEQHVLLYETPNFPQAQREKEPFDRMTTASYAPLSFRRADITELANNGRIVDGQEPRKGNGYSTHIGWTDIERLDEKNGTKVDISRVTGDQESMERIVAQLGYAMGMDGQSLATLAETVKSKA